MEDFGWDPGIWTPDPIMSSANLSNQFCYMGMFFIYFIAMAANAQAESVIKNIIKEICIECNSQGTNISETLAAFMVSAVWCMLLP